MSALAMTSVFKDTKTGEILDTDIEPLAFLTLGAIRWLWKKRPVRSERAPDA